MEALFTAAVLLGVILYVSRPYAVSENKFCNDCGGKNPENSRFCGQCGKALLAVLIMLFASWAQAQGMPPIASDSAAQPPHSKMETGQLEGTLTKDGKPQAGREIVIQVQQGGQVLLTLPKKTDGKGQFIFKNIFKDPQYSYILLTEDDGKIYRHGPLQLTGKQDALKVVFAIKPEAVVDMDSQPMAPDNPRAMSHGKAPDQWQQQQTISIVLAGLVLAIMAYALGRYQKKK